MNQNRLTEVQRQGMSDRINQIVQLKFRESQNQPTKSSSNYHSQQQQGLKENSGSKSGSKQNIWTSSSVKNNMYFNNDQNSGQKQANRMSRIKQAQNRINSSSSQVSVKRDKSINSYEQSDSFNAGVSISSGINNQTKKSRGNNFQQYQYFEVNKKLSMVPSLSQHQSIQNISKNYVSPNNQLLAYNSSNIHPYAKVVHGQNKGYVNNYMTHKGENATETPEEIVNLSMQQQKFDQQPEEHLYLEQIKIQEQRIAQLEELLKQETLNCEQYRSQISILKAQVLRSVSESGLVSLFEEAYIASIDNQVEVLVQLKDIQQKIEIDVTNNQQIIVDQDQTIKDLMERNHQLSSQVEELYSLNHQLDIEFKSNIENRKQNDQEKFYLIESNNKLVNDIENAIQQSSRLIDENHHYIKQLDEKNIVISQLETLLKDQNENKLEFEAAQEEKEQTIQKQIQDIFELNEELKELKLQNEDFESLLKDYQEKLLILKEQQQEAKQQNSHEKRNKKREEEHEEQRQQRVKEEEAEKQRYLQTIQSNINHLEKQVNNLEQKNNQLSQQIENNQIMIKQRDNQVVELEKLLKKREEDILEANNQKHDLKSQAESIQKLLQQAQQQLKQQQQQHSEGIHHKEDVTKFIQENNALKVGLADLQVQCEQLKQQNIHHVNANSQLQELVEQNQKLLKQANQELAIKNQQQQTQISPQILQEYDRNFEELNTKVIELHTKYHQSEDEKDKLTEEIAYLKHELENEDEKFQQIQYMQQKADFFSSQLVVMSKLINIIDQEDECIEQDQYESVVIQIKDKIEELLKENEQLKQIIQESKESEKLEKDSQPILKVSQIQSLDNSLSDTNKLAQKLKQEENNQNEQNNLLGEIEEEQNEINELTFKYEKQIEELNQQLQDVQMKLAEIYQQKYILETYINQIKEFVPNEEVQELLSKYCETISELITNESCQKRIQENISELEQGGEEEEQQEDDQQNGELSERVQNIQQHLGALQEIQSQHQDLIQHRDELGEQIVFISQKENEKYYMIQELQQQNQQLYEELLLVKNEIQQYQQSDHSSHMHQNGIHMNQDEEQDEQDDQDMQQDENERVNQYYSQELMEQDGEDGTNEDQTNDDC